MSWAVERLTGPASTFHARSLPDPVERVVAVLAVDRPALVLGSTQPESDVDGAALADAGIELVRRRSGGGAVLLRPAEALWVDVELPAGDELWDDDVGRSFHWLGRVWAGALADLGVEADVHTGPLLTSPWSRLVCFGGLGPGEVTVDGRKVVGISQRRTRAGARLQSVVLGRWEPRELVDLLTLGPERAARAEADLLGRARGLDRPLADVAAAVLDRLAACTSG